MKHEICKTMIFQILRVIEAKSIQKNTFPCNFRQYEDMKELYDKHIQGIEIGVIV